MSKIPSCIIFSSGTGTTLDNIIKKIESGYLNIRIAAVVSTSNTAGCLDIAKNHKINSFVLSKDFNKSTEELNRILDEISSDFLILAGYMRKIPLQVIKKYENRILNIHPSLLPKFGGPGMYGEHVHKAVIESKSNESGSTVHLVTENYDEGPIILQDKIEVSLSESVESLSTKVKKLERNLFPIAINLFIHKYLNIPVIFDLGDFKLIKSNSILGIFGGTFDPIHEGHLSDIKNLLNICETVVIAPTSQNPWKERNATDLNKRLDMIELTLKYENLPFSYDLNKTGLILSKDPYHYSIDFLDLVRKNRNKQSEESMYWAIGKDLNKQALDWKNWEEKGISFICLPLVPNKSSTGVRSGEIKPHIALKNYILENNLYDS